ncbi:MAG TPA: CocE/NonD family hydrolase C-terminal non-catalytic domain-containing protein, partial [Actinomycetota bacterium]|nr:CocE/NonD family hydrolase C-terminal non-catalytic domain-containing protein [Actinomycetota bacterium]
LQRGVLRGGHRAFDHNLSQKSTAPDPHDPASGPYVYRPFRAHASNELVTPGTVTEYLVEVFPVGHVVRAGHKLQVKVQAPSRVDSYYAYVPKAAPGINTLHFSATRPSRITLPFVGLPTGISGSTPPACGAQEAVRCVK